MFKFLALIFVALYTVNGLPKNLEVEGFFRRGLVLAGPAEVYLWPNGTVPFEISDDFGN